MNRTVGGSKGYLFGTVTESRKETDSKGESSGPRIDASKLNKSVVVVVVVDYIVVSIIKININ